MNQRIETPPAVAAAEVAHEALLHSVGDAFVAIGKLTREPNALHYSDQEEALCKLIDRLDHERMRLVGALESAQELADRPDPDAEENRWNAEHSTVTP